MQKITRLIKVHTAKFAKVDISTNTIVETKEVTFVGKPTNRHLAAVASDLGMICINMEEKLESVWTTTEAFYNLCKQTMAQYDGEDGMGDNDITDID